MSKDNLGNKQTIVLHNSIINDERYDLEIKPHRQTIGYKRTKRQTLRKKYLTKKNIRKRFSKQKNAVLQTETSAIQELHNLKNSINENHQIDNQIYFSDSETTSQSSIQGKPRIKTHTKTNQYVCTIGINQ